MRPIPPARTNDHTRNAIPATGTTYDLTVNRCLIWCTGNQIAGKLQSQKMKNETKSLVVRRDGGPDPIYELRKHDFVSMALCNLI